MAGRREHETGGTGAPAALGGVTGAVATRARGRVCDLDPSDPAWQAAELAQRGRMILDVTAADLDAAEEAHGPFHPTAGHFRDAWYEARRSWDRLRAQLGGAKLAAALEEPPLTVLPLGRGAEGYAPDRDGRWPVPVPASGRPAPVLLILIAGRTYRAQPVGGTPLAPVIWRLTHLRPSEERERPRARSGSNGGGGSDDGPYHVCRLHDGTTQCDCAEWIFRVADAERPGPAPTSCKHLDALTALRWL